MLMDLINNALATMTQFTDSLSGLSDWAYVIGVVGTAIAVATS
jgi:hypothetical protein